MAQALSLALAGLLAAATGLVADFGQAEPGESDPLPFTRQSVSHPGE